MLRFGSVRLALPAVSFDDVSVGTVRFGATWKVGGGRWELGGGRWGRWEVWEVGVGGGQVGRWGGWEEVGGGRRWEGGVRGRWEVEAGGRASVRFGAVPNSSVRFDTGAGGSIRYSVKVLLKRP